MAGFLEIRPAGGIPSDGPQHHGRIQRDRIEGIDRQPNGRTVLLAGGRDGDAGREAAKGLAEFFLIDHDRHEASPVLLAPDPLTAVSTGRARN